ncbi:MAG: HAD family hydrolase [Bacteroidales bacterium]|nr:HAD family hydrolase [Bacteroidales bacterium]
MKIRLFIFDLDGTLLDSIDDIAFSMNHVLEKNGFPTHQRDAYYYFVGDGARLLMERALPESFRTAAQVDALLPEFMAYYDLHKADRTKPFDGLLPTMEKLQAAGALFAVASNKPHEVMPELMRHYFPSIRFAVILGHRKGHPIKPDPEIVHDILAETGADRCDVLYVGDTAVDVRTAHAAGVRMAGALWGFRTRQELVDAGADLLLEKPESLLTV